MYRLHPRHTRLSLVSHNWSAVFRTVFDTVCGGNTFVFAAFALSVGIAREDMGLFTAVLSFACLIQMLGLPLVSRYADRKRLIVLLSVLEPLVMIAAVLLVPFCPRSLRLYALMLAALAAAACLHLTRPMVEDWLALLIPAGLRGRFWGRRLQLTSATSILAAPLVGAAAGWLGERNTVSLALLLSVGGAFGLLSALALRRAHVPPALAATPVRAADIPATLRVPAFRRYLAGVMLLWLPFYFVMSYYQVYHLTVMHMGKFTIGCVVATYGLVKILAARPWGKALNRLGPRRIMLRVVPVFVLLFACYAFIRPRDAWVLFAAWAAAGFADAGWTISLQSSLYGAVPEAGARPAFFAVFNLLTLGLYGVGSALAVPILKALQDVTVQLGPFVFDQFRIFFGAASLLMIAGSAGAWLLPRHAAPRKRQVAA